MRLKNRRNLYGLHLQLFLKKYSIGVKFSWIRINLNTKNYMDNFQLEFKLIRVNNIIFQ